MPQRTDVFDLPRLGLTSGEGRRLDLHVSLEPFLFGGETYTAEPDVVPVRLDVSRKTGNGWALRLRFAIAVTGPATPPPAISAFIAASLPRYFVRTN